MKYIIGIHMHGSFPGSPDHKYYVVDEYLESLIHGNLLRCKWFDTYEDAYEEINKK